MLTRVFFSNNGTLTDLSTNLDNYFSGTETIDIVSSEDKIFIGSPFPFNHRYIKVSSANALSSVMTVKYWDGNNFVDVVELIDETSVSGKTLAQSGFISFVPHKDKPWTREDTVENATELVTGLGGVTVYDHYWLQLTFSDDLTAATALSWVGFLFSNDDDLGAEFPSLTRTNTKSAFKTGKTDWEEQHIVAARLMIDDLKTRKVISSPDQMLDRREYSKIAVQKAAEIIFNAFGDDYADNRDKARSEYQERIKQDLLTIDRSNDGRVSMGERLMRQGRLFR